MSERTDLVELLAAVLRPGSSGNLVERLCARAHDELPVDGVVVTLMSPPDHRHVVCASDDEAVLAEDVQFTLGDGPVVEAFRDRVPVLVPDLPHEALSRWPMLGEADARWPRFAGVFAFPLELADDALGVMGLYRRAPGPLEPDVTARASLLAEALALAVVRAVDRPEGKEPGEDDTADELALTRWSGAEQVVYQAVGMVVAQLRLEPSEAMTRLRAHAFAAGRTLDEVSLDVVERRLRLNR